MHILFPIDTEVLYVHPETGALIPAKIKRQDTPGSAYIWLDDKGQETAHANFSDDAKEKGTIHLNRGEPAKSKQKPFKPGADAPAA